MSKIPDRIHIDANDRDLYTKIEQEELFKDRSRKEEFLMAMAIGFENNVHIPIKKKEGFFLRKDMSNKDEILLNLVALEENSIDILQNKEKVYQLAEEYAHAGIEILTNNIDSMTFGSYEKVFEKVLLELYNKHLGVDS